MATKSCLSTKLKDFSKTKQTAYTPIKNNVGAYTSVICDKVTILSTG